MQRAGFFLWILICGVLVCDIGNACVRAADPSPSIKTHEVDIVNTSGVTVIQLMDTSDGPQIDVCNASGIVRMMPSTNNDGSVIGFFDTNLNDPVTLGYDEEQDSLIDALRIAPPGQVSVNLYSRSADTSLSIRDKAGKERVMATYSPKDDFSEFGTESAKDQTAVVATVWGKIAHMATYDPNGTARADFGVEPSNNAYFALVGKDGTAAWQKTFDANGSPSTLGDNSSGSAGSDSGIGAAIRRNGSP